MWISTSDEDPEEAANHRAEYQRLIAQNRSRGLGADEDQIEAAKFIEEQRVVREGPPAVPPTRTQRAIGIVVQVLFWLVVLVALSKAPIRGVY